MWFVGLIFDVRVCNILYIGYVTLCILYIGYAAYCKIDKVNPIDLYQSHGENFEHMW